MLSMSTTTCPASASDTSVHCSPRRALASRNVALRAVSVAGSMPVRPSVSGIARGPWACEGAECCGAGTCRQRACCGSYGCSASPAGAMGDPRLARCVTAHRAGASVPWTAGELAGQEGHLVGEDVAVGEDQVLDPAGAVGHRQEGHACLRRRATALARVAGEARGHDVLPDVGAAA